jgi:rhomboid protease GluP
LAAAMPRPWVSYALLGINAIVFLLMIATGVSAIDPTTPELLAWGADFGPWTVGGEWWRLVSNAFVHIGVLHLLLNMWCLQGAGPLAERLLGHGVFAVVYVFSGILGSLVSIAWNPTWVSAGASGAVFGTYGALFVCSLKLRRNFPTDVFEPIRNSALVFVLYNIHYGLRTSNIDHAAHVGGLSAGLLATWLL